MAAARRPLALASTHPVALQEHRYPVAHMFAQDLSCSLALLMHLARVAGIPAECQVLIRLANRTQLLCQCSHLSATGQTQGHVQTSYSVTNGHTAAMQACMSS